MTIDARHSGAARALWLLAVLASLAFMRFAAALLIPIVLGVLIALALEPVVGWLVRHRIHRGVAAGLVLPLVFLVFFLLQGGPRAVDQIVALGRTPARRDTLRTIVGDIRHQVQQFLLVTLFTAVVVAVATFAVLAWMQVAHAWVWGVLAGLFNVVPYFGPVVVSGGMFAVGLVQQGDAGQAVKMAGAALAITALEGWVITPPLMGRAERMSVLSVFVGLLLFSWLWGAWGTLLAVPMLAAVKAVGDHVDGLKGLGRLLAP